MTAKSMFRSTALCGFLALALAMPAFAQDVAVFPQLGHSEEVGAVAYSPDGKRIVSGSSDGTIKIWDAETGRELRTLFAGHTSSVKSVVYSPDGKRILSASDKMIKIWDAETGRELRTLGHTTFVYSVAYSPDGKRIVFGSGDKTVRIWDAETGRELRTLGHTTFAYSAAYSPDGKRIVSGSSDGTIKTWDAETGRELRTLSGHTKYLKSVVYSPDGKRILSESGDDTVRIWDAENGRELKSLKLSARVLVYSPDGKSIVSAHGDTITIWDIESGQELRSFSAKVFSIRSVAYSPDGKRIVSGPGTFEIVNKTIRIWDAETGQELMTLGGYTDDVNCVAYSPNGKLIASGYGSYSDSEDYVVRIWDVENGRGLRLLKGHTGFISSVAFSLDGKRIVSSAGNGSASSDCTVRIWDTENGHELLTIKNNVVGRSVAFSPNGKRVICGFADSNAIKIWDVDGGKVLSTLSGHKNAVFSVAYSPDGKHIVSGSWDKTIKIWDAENGRELRTLSGHADGVNSVAYSPDGKHIVSGSRDKTIKIWDAETGRELRTLSGHADIVSSVAYSPDGKHIVSGSRDKTIKIWDAENGRELRTLSGHTYGISSVAYSPDGKHIVSSSYEDYTTRLWDISTGKEIAQFIAFVGSDTQLASASRGLAVETETAAASVDGEWLAITPDGYYQASPRGDRYLNVRVNNTVSGVDAYRSIFYNPNVVQARLQGRPDPASKANVTIQQAAAFIPPEVAIQSPANFSTTNTATTNLSVNITSQAQPIKNIKIIVNGRLIGKDELAAVKGTGLQPQKASLTVTGNQKTVNLSLPLELDPGNNRIEVVAFNGYSESRRFVDVTRNAPAGEKPALPNLWIVAVGVNGYDNAGTKLQGLSNLNFAVADAKGLVDSLKAQEGKRYAKVNTMLISDGEAQAPTTANIRQGLKFLEGADPRRDVVILFLAGHGISAQESKFFFLPKDAVFTGNRVVDASKAISGDEIMTVLDAPGNRLVFIDACQSGGVDNDRMVRSLMDTNAFVFTASRGNELSYESKELGHGFFTYSVMSALKGAPAALAQGNVSVLSMSGFVRDDVPKKTGGRQNPSAYSLGFYDFPVAVIK